MTYFRNTPQAFLVCLLHACAHVLCGDRGRAPRLLLARLSLLCAQVQLAISMTRCMYAPYEDIPVFDLQVIVRAAPSMHAFFCREAEEVTLVQVHGFAVRRSAVVVGGKVGVPFPLSPDASRRWLTRAQHTHTHAHAGVGR